jgi:hypothetical protein
MRPRKITGKRLTTLRSEGIRNPTLEALRFGGAVVYDLPDGGVLDDFDTFGILWLSQEAYREFCKESKRKSAASPRHVLDGRLAASREFPSNIESLVLRLGELLKVPASQLDYSIASLALVDDRIARSCSGSKGIDPEDLVDPAIAYAGEVMRSAVSGRWEMRDSGSAGVSLPVVVAPDGTAYSPALLVCDELLEQFPKFSLGGAVEGELLSGRRSPIH